MNNRHRGGVPMFKRFTGFFILLLCTPLCFGDSITVNGIKKDGVLVTESKNLYYIQIPQDGTTLNVPKPDASDLVISADQSERKTLSETWRKNHKSATPSNPQTSSVSDQEILDNFSGKKNKEEKISDAITVSDSVGNKHSVQKPTYEYVPQQKTTSTTQNVKSHTASTSVAENGSYYGQTSKATGRPKTVHVSGYHRKDGTYVRGHYRSSPR